MYIYNYRHTYIHTYTKGVGGRVDGLRSRRASTQTMLCGLVGDSTLIMLCGLVSDTENASHAVHALPQRASTLIMLCGV
jgi:hypothetical protein